MDADPFDEVGDHEPDHVGDLVKAVEGRHGSDAVSELVDAFNKTRQADAAEARERELQAAEDATKRAYGNMLEYVGLFKAGLIDTGLKLLRESENDDGTINIDKLNKRLAAIKVSQQAADKIEDRALGTPTKRVQQEGQVDVVHKLEDYQQQLLEGRVLDDE